MGKYFGFQISSILKNPTIYFVLFLITPLLFFLSGSFLPATITLSGIIVFLIFSMTFFVIGTNIYQVKSTSFFKRFNSLGISKMKYIFVNGLISILLSLAAVYIFIEMLATTSFFVNFSYATVSYENNTSIEIGTMRHQFRTLTPSGFSWFFGNDILSALNDGFFLLLIDELSRVVDVDHLINGLNSFIEYDLPNSVMNPAKEIAFDASINGFISLWLVPHSEDWMEFVNSQYLYIDENGHAPIDIITKLVINGDVGVEDPTDIGFWVDGEGSLWVATTATYEIKIEDTSPLHIEEFRIRLFYSKIMPTFSTIFSPILNFNTMMVDDVMGVTGLTMVPFYTEWIIFFFTFLLLALIGYSIMILINAISRNFEQYYFLSGLFVFVILIFSGIFMPYTFFVATPFIYSMTLLVPTTSPIMLMQQLIIDDKTSVPLQIDFFTANLFGYPLATIVISLSIGYKMLSKDGNLLVSKYTHDLRSNRAAKTNLVTNIIFLFISVYVLWKLLNMRINYFESSETKYYPENWLIEISINQFSG